MSQTKITVERVNEVKPHPNADRLDVVQVLGYQVVSRRDQFKVGDTAIYFPPDILIPEEIAEELGVVNYLKHAIYPGDQQKSKCRVGAARLRGQPSYGFVIGPVDSLCGFGTDVTRDYYAHKYEPPQRLNAGDQVSEWPNFHRYTDIENIQRYPDAIPVGTLVQITEKLHGTNCRLGLLKNAEGTFELVAGSHKVQRKQPSLYWEPMTQVMSMLFHLSHGEHDVIVYGEIFGPGVQDMDYGQKEKAFRVFDISVDGRYLDRDDLDAVLLTHGVLGVPILFRGEFSRSILEQYTDGPSRMPSKKFKGREGIVITPMEEQYSEILAGRMIVKSISVDYLDRKEAKDID